MIRPPPASISPCASTPSPPIIRETSTKPKASASQSIAAGPSSYAIIGITPCIMSPAFLGLNKHLSRIQDPVRVENFLDAFHDLECRAVDCVAEIRRLDIAD